ncbi:MAG: hypothetical protein ACI9QD_000918 [Thermoproteota archaeon]|jgi:hypothetical protein
MKKIAQGILMTTLITLSSFAVPAYSSVSMNNSVAKDKGYETKWCRDASYILNGAIVAAYNAETFKKEVAILKRAITRTSESLNPKFNYYLDSTLNLAIDIDKHLFQDKDKALFLRRQVENALHDLSYLDGFFSQRRSADHSSYVRMILKRIEVEALRAKTDQIEKAVLDAGAKAGAETLADSDFRRNSSNACAVVYLKEVLELDDVFYKRSLIDQAIESLEYGCY